jgi:ubiquinone/menaquinone biosynthesis C-methylase UbiE
MTDESAQLPFAEAAPYYAFRAPYAPQALAFVRDTFQLDAASSVLDLGCGPGTIAIPLARTVGHVVAVDPSEAMLGQGRLRAQESGRNNIDWICARAEDFTAQAGTFDAVTLGQSFHWMDRDVVLRRLAPMIADGGGLALINPGRRRPQESWEEIASEVIARYLGARPRHPRTNPEPQNEPALLRSAAFSRFTASEFAMDFERDVPSIIGYVYSMSVSPRSAFGERVAAFERELSEALLRASPSGVFREHLETEVIVARKTARPAPNAAQAGL